MPTVMENFEHETTTTASGHRYLFTTKHHGGPGSQGEAQWVSDLAILDEFAIFDAADEHDISDSRGFLYGVRRLPDGSLMNLGTWQQQIAAFVSSSSGQPWHGYPLYAIVREGPEKLRGDRCKPEKSVFQKLLRTGQITARQHKRLKKGDHT